MARMRDRLSAPVLIGVGAAFDFHAGHRRPGARRAAAGRARVGVPAQPGAAPPVAALPALQPALRDRLRAAVRGAICAAASAASLPRAMSYDVSVIGLGRVGLPLALCFADAGPARAGRRPATPSASTRCAPAGCRSRSPGTDELLARVPLDLSPHAADAAQADAIVLTLGTPSLSHIEIDMGDIRAVLDDLLPLLREGQLLVLRSTVAPGTTEFVAGYLEKHRGLARRRGRARRPRARADRRRPLPGGDRHAAVHRRRRRRGVAASAPPSCSPASGRRSCTPRPCRPSWRRSGPTSCATRRSRSPTC